MKTVNGIDFNFPQLLSPSSFKVFPVYISILNMEVRKHTIKRFGVESRLTFGSRIAVMYAV